MSVLSRRPGFTNARATNFYYSFVFLPAEKRRAIEAVYAFARRGDDAVDVTTSKADAERKVARCRRELDACYQGNGNFDQGPELRALAEAIERFRIPRAYFEDLILGFEMDLNITRYGTFDELRLYCYRVASTIGLIAIEIFGYRNPGSRDYAVNLGTALQLVNILRDLHTDARRGRVYIPEEDFAQFGVQRQDLLEARPTDRLRELMRFEAGRARSYFRAARKALPDEDRRSMLAAEIMAAIYWRLLGRIERPGHDVFGAKARLSRPVKFWTAVSVYLGKEWFKNASGK